MRYLPTKTRLHLHISPRQVARISASLLMITLLLHSQTTFAASLTKDELFSINSQTSFFDKNACQPGSTSTSNPDTGGQTDITKSKNAKTVFEYFTESNFQPATGKHNYSPAQAAGIVGNFWVESKVNPTEEQVGGGGGYGIAQFTPPTAMRAWVTANGEDPNSLQGQLDYVAYQLNNTETAARDALTATSTPQDAADKFETQYERPQDPPASQSAREGAAVDAFGAFAKDAGTPPVAADSSNCTNITTTASVNCQNASGDAKILCEAEDYTGIWYTFGGGHGGYANFRSQCPLKQVTTLVKSGPHKGETLAAVASTQANPGPCTTDCSALVSIAVDQAFNHSFNYWIVAGTMQGVGSQNWKPISMSQLQPGDIVTTSEHVEIVQGVFKNTLFTFGSHHTGTKTGEVSGSLFGYYTAAYRWQDPGQGVTPV
jgi:hypothetical protein